MCVLYLTYAWQTGLLRVSCGGEFFSPYHLLFPSSPILVVWSCWQFAREWFSLSDCFWFCCCKSVMFLRTWELKTSMHTHTYVRKATHAKSHTDSDTHISYLLTHIHKSFAFFSPSIVSTHARKFVSEMNCMYVSMCINTHIHDVRSSFLIDLYVCACMYVCMYMCMFVFNTHITWCKKFSFWLNCMYVCMYVRTYVCMYIETHIHNASNICFWPNCIYVCTYACMHACMYVCVCMYICIHTHTRIIHKYIHTYMHIYMHRISHALNVATA
jgi:hypothetical protein